MTPRFSRRLRCRDRVLVIDDDLAQSGRTAENRLGFQRPMAEVGLDHVGVVLGIEMSRIARSNKDWHQLLELCAMFRTLLADQDGLYDPTNFNDRLLLGLKGTMSEAELHILRSRMENGRRNKARRGELFSFVPTGYVLTPSGEVIKEPDQSVDVTEASSHRWPRLFPGPIIGRNEEWNSTVILEFCERSHEIGIDQYLRCPPDSRESWFVHHGKPAGRSGARVF